MSSKNEIKLSPSSLAYLFESKCPAAYDFSKRLEYIGPERPEDEYMKRGLLVHSLMQGAIKTYEVKDRYANSLYEKLIAIKRQHKIETQEVELWQDFKIIPRVSWRRRLDVIGHTSNRRIILDWKTAAGAWKKVDSNIGLVPPQSMGIQAIGYLIPPPKVENWPTELWFVVVSYKGPAEIFKYYYNEKDHKNLLLAITVARDMIEFFNINGYPKIRGKACLSCSYREPCYEVYGWEKSFEMKELHKGDYKLSSKKSDNK
mgnify:CR=1 FL=1